MHVCRIMSKGHNPLIDRTSIIALMLHRTGKGSLRKQVVRNRGISNIGETNTHSPENKSVRNCNFEHYIMLSQREKRSLLMMT